MLLPSKDAVRLTDRRWPRRLESATALAATTGKGFLGLSHVDLMDMHVRRLPGKPPVLTEAQTPAVVAERYANAVRSGADLHRWSLYWDLLDANADVWGTADGIVARDHDAGLASLLILQGIPARLAEGPGADGAAFNPGGTWRPVGTVTGLHEPIFSGPNGPTDDPAIGTTINPGNPWAGFVDEAAVRYSPGGTLARSRGWAAGQGVRRWQIGNEPNHDRFWPGSPAAYARLLEVASLVLKRHDAGATVVHAGIADTGDPRAWYTRFAAALQARAGVSPLPASHVYYFDAAAWHVYNEPGRIAERTSTGRAILASAGLPAKPIWITEFGLPVWSEYPGPCWDATSPHRGTAAEQAAYLWQMAAEGLAAGVERMILFQLYDDCGNGESSYDALGLVRNHAGNQCWTPPEHHPACWRQDAALAGTARPAFAAFQAAARELSGARLVARTAPTERTQRLTFQRGADTRVTVAWSADFGSGDVTIDASGPAATLFRIESDGSVSARAVAPAAAPGRDTQAATASYPLSLPGATNRNNGSGGPMVWGRPAMLVEGGATPAEPGNTPAEPGAALAGGGAMPPIPAAGAEVEATPATTSGPARPSPSGSEMRQRGGRAPGPFGPISPRYH